VFPA
jgi:hypothetical protein